MTEWPRHIFYHPAPAPKVARRVANEVRAATGQSMERALDLEPVLQAGRFKAYITDIGRAKDGTRAFLIPARNDRFHIPADPIYGERSYKKLEGLDLEPDFFMLGMFKHLVAHEIAHSFFYYRAPGQRPLRTSPTHFSRPTPNATYEERFCEEFARQLLAPREVVRALELDRQHLAEKFEITVALAKAAMSEQPMLKIDRKDPANYDYTVPPKAPKPPDDWF